MLQATSITFGYKKYKPVFQDLSIELNAGKIYGLLGKNGAGKTTLLKLLSSLLYPWSGQVTLNGLSAYTRSPLYLEQIFLVPEEFSVPQMSIKMYLDFYSPFYKNFDKDKFYDYIDAFELKDNQKILRMSYGQKKKFMLSFALASNTKVVLMDEPTNGLDIPSKSTFRKICAESLEQDRILLISTHQVKDVEGLIDQVTIIDNSKIILDKSINELSEKIQMKMLEELPQNTLFAQETFGGWKAILPNNGNSATQIDFELLFSAAIDKAQKLTSYLNN